MGIFDFLKNKPEKSPDSVEHWNADEWKRKYKTYMTNGDVGEMKRMNADVFQNTIKIAREGSYFVEGKGICTLPSEKIDKMQKGTKFYSEEFNVNEVPAREDETVVKVECADCLDVALRLKDEGYNVAVLNLANQYNPGGGVIHGARAQEESLFRRTNLFQSLFQFVSYAKGYGVPESREHHYPMDDNFGGVYTPNAIVFRSSGDEGYRLTEGVEMSFIAVAAIDHPPLTKDNRIADTYVELTKNKIRTIYRIGLENGHDALVLGAFGCGAFRNPPQHIAQLFREVLDEPEFKNKFRLIDFAILDNHHSHKSHNPEGNFKPFLDVFDLGQNR